VLPRSTDLSPSSDSREAITDALALEEGLEAGLSSAFASLNMTLLGFGR
jgi:hypothetical protein